MMKKNIFTTFELWPIRLNLLDHIIYTLWGSLGEEKDLVLAYKNNIHFFNTEKGLLSFIQAQKPCIFSPSEKYKDFAYNIKNWSNIKDEISFFDLTKVGKLLFKFDWKNWDKEECSMVVDCFYLLWDMANTISNKMILVEYLEKKIPNWYFFIRTNFL